MIVNIKGNIEIIEDKEDIMDKVREYMGDDMVEALNEYILPQENTEWEIIADGYSSALRNALDITLDLMKYVENTKRLKRDEILKTLKDMVIEIENEI